jgi:hypothetical protein
MRRSAHPVALTALIALAQGFFCFVDEDRDVLCAHRRDAEHDLLERSLARSAAPLRDVAPLAPDGSHPHDVFGRSYQRGAEIGRSGSSAELRAALAALGGLCPESRLFAVLGLGHGFFRPLRADDSLAVELAILDELLPAGAPLMDRYAPPPRRALERS